MRNILPWKSIPVGIPEGEGTEERPERVFCGRSFWGASFHYCNSSSLLRAEGEHGFCLMTAYRGRTVVRPGLWQTPFRPPAGHLRQGTTNPSSCHTMLVRLQHGVFCCCHESSLPPLRCRAKTRRYWSCCSASRGKGIESRTQLAPSGA